MKNVTNTSTNVRRERILEAARRVFSASGGLNAGLRPIAAEAGLTTGAIYSVFSSKEDIYATLLEDSLTDLSLSVASAAGRRSDPKAALRSAAEAFFSYYRAHPFEYSLGLYLFETDGRKGLGPARDSQLNLRLGETLNVFEACFERLSPNPDGPPARSLAQTLFAGLLGILAMWMSGRDRSIGSDAESLLEALLYLCTLTAKI